MKKIIASLFIAILLTSCSNGNHHVMHDDKDKDVSTHINFAKFVTTNNDEKSEVNKTKFSHKKENKRENEEQNLEQASELDKQSEDHESLKDLHKKYSKKAQQLEASIQDKWNNNEATGTGEIANLIYENYEAWEELMVEVLENIQTNTSEEQFNKLASEQNKWKKERDELSEEIANDSETLGLMATNEAYDILMMQTKDRTYELIETYFK